MQKEIHKLIQGGKTMLHSTAALKQAEVDVFLSGKVDFKLKTNQQKKPPHRLREQVDRERKQL